MNTEVMPKKKQFLQLQFSILLIVCSLLPDFGNLLGSALGLGGLSIAVIIARVIGIIFGGWALFNLYKEKKQLPTPFLIGVGGGLVITLVTLTPGTPIWLDYIALALLLFSLWTSKSSVGIQWNTLSTQGAYLILLACLLNCYHSVDSKISTSIAALIGLIIYLVGLGKLKKSLDTPGIKGASRLKIAVWLGIVGVIIGLIPLLGTIIAGILGIIAFIFEFLGYTSLMKSEPLHELGQNGAKTLRWSMIIMVIANIINFFPLTGLIVGIITLIALFFIYKGWTNILFGLEQDTAFATTEEQPQDFSKQGEQALASAKESFAKAQDSLTPKIEKAKAWLNANKKGLGIIIGSIAAVALLAWALPKLFGITPKGIAFETYEVMDEIQVTIDIPQGNSEREQNVMKGLREIIAQSEMCKKDVIGAPIEGSIQEIIADCQKRYQKFAEDFCKESGAPAPPLCQLFIESGYQNEECVTFQVDDGVYFNGAPDTYFRIIRFSDGHVMEVGEMISITKEEVETIAKKYYKEEDGFAPVYVEDGFNILPAANDSCKITWVAGHGWGEVLVPLSEIESHLTDEGKKIFMAKPLDVPEKKGAKVAEQGEEQVTKDEQSQEEADGMDMEGYGSEGLLGSLPNGTTEYVGEMAGFPIEFTITKSEEGLRAKYKNVKFSATMQLEGESLPAQGGNISFYGDDSAGKKWFFELEGNADHITGTAQGDGKELPVILYKK